jgi:GTP-binding protein
MIETYITTREQLRAVVLLIDVRHPPSKDDVLMYGFLKHYEIPTIIVATKADKIPKSKWQKHVKVIKDSLNMEKSDSFVLFSSETGQGKDEAWKIIQSYTS